MKIRFEVKVLAISTLVVAALVVATQPAYALAKELVNTATKEIDTPVDMGKRDFLEETYSELLDMKSETGHDYVVVEHGNVMTIKELEK